jgi:hypothetical protein
VSDDIVVANRIALDEDDDIVHKRNHVVSFYGGVLPGQDDIVDRLEGPLATHDDIVVFSDLSRVS